VTEHDDAITPLLRGAPHLGLALGPAPARAGPVYKCLKWVCKVKKLSLATEMKVITAGIQ